MAFFARQQDEVNPLTEVSTVTLNPGAVGNGATVSVSVAATLPGGGAASFNNGDLIEIFPPAVAALNGLHISAFPTATAGTVQVYFINATGGSITPVSASYKLVATRMVNTLVS